MEPLCLASLPSVMFSRLVLVVSPRLFWVCCVFIVWIDPILLTCSSAGRHLHCPPWRRGWLQVLTYSSVRMLCPTRGVAPLLVLSDCSSGHSLWSWVMAWASCQVPVLAQVASVELLGDCVHAEGSPGPVGRGGAPLQSWFPHLGQNPIAKRLLTSETGGPFYYLWSLPVLGFPLEQEKVLHRKAWKRCVWTKCVGSFDLGLTV